MKSDIEIWEEMMSGRRYNAAHPYLINRLIDTRDRLFEFNNLLPSKIDEQQNLLREILGTTGKRFHINQPFRCDYGCNIHIGENFFANFNLTILDEAEVRIGNNCFIGPNVSIYTACHPLEPEDRARGIEWSEVVTIGNDVWIGGSVTIVPGVTIGNNVVIGAGSVVTKSFPDNVLIAGNPAKIIKQLK